MRMSPCQFQEILTLLYDKIQKQHTNWREPILPHVRLAITLRHLATGESKRSLSYQYLVGRLTVTNIVAETTKAIWDVLKDKYMKAPTQEDFQTAAKKFESHWNFPNCIGAIDGKHIRIRCPKNSSSQYYNYKKFYSIVLMAVVDADYKFMLIDVGSEGSSGDSGVFTRSTFGRSIINETIDTPHPQPIANGMVMPYVFVADEAFPLRKNIMRPYPGGLSIADRQKRVYNYRLSRARLVVENAFGILAARWRIFYTAIDSKLETIDSIIKACCCLHNFLMARGSDYCPRIFGDTTSSNGRIIDGTWRHAVQSTWGQTLNRQGSNNSSSAAIVIRNNFSEFFYSSEGALPWQNEYLFQ